MEYLKTVFFKNIQIGELSLPFSLFEILVKFILPLLLMLVVYKIINRVVASGLKRSRLNEEKQRAVAGWVKTILRFILLFTIIALFVNLFGAEIGKYIGSFWATLNYPFLGSGDSGISLVTIMLIAPVVYLSGLAGKLARNFTEHNLLPYLKLEEEKNRTVSVVVKYIAIGLIFLFGLSVIGIDLSAFSVVFGVLGIGLGFGLQGMVSNMFAGIVMISTRPVKINDHILVDGTEGRIINIRLLSTIVSTGNHQCIIIPNRKLIENEVYNYSFDDRKVIVENKIQVAYDSDLDRVLELLEEVAKNCPYRYRANDIITRVHSFDDSGITVGTRVWINDSKETYAAKSWINLELWRCFKKNSVEIPFPQMDVRIKNWK